MNMEGGASSNLPPGFHFYPSDEELVAHFLAGKAALLPAHPDIIPVVHLHRHDPWELVGKALQAGNQWYFFNRISTQSRASPNGYWSPTGVDKPITSAGRDVGVKKTLAFYVDGDRPLKGIKTNWVMHEYHLLDHSLSNSSSSSSSNNNSSRRSIKKRGHQRILVSTELISQQYNCVITHNDHCIRNPTSGSSAESTSRRPAARRRAASATSSTVTGRSCRAWMKSSCP
ncbi:NAC domain-containing protein 104-like isoform X1 [Typha angustifolia]|uniref:NAC domain-containing protein 104-like isoform X1 n=1 Tax=Typha angustifolia TaxID=59011 RepID=UPI003C2C281E